MATVTTQERTNILKLVAGMFNAAPGAAYLNEFTDAFVAMNKDYAALAANLGQTGAFQSLYPSFLTAEEFANKFLDTLGLKANTEAQDWVKAKVNAGESYASVIFQALVAIDASTSADFKAARDQLANKAAVAEHYSVTLQASSNDLATLQNVVAKVTDDPASVTAANEANAGGNGETYMLTKGQDNVPGTAGNDTIVGSVASGDAELNTFSALDIINGGAGTDTLKISTVGGTGNDINVGANVTNVEIVEASSAGSLKVNTSASTGVETLKVTGANGTIEAQASATANIAIEQDSALVASGVATIATLGGKDVSVSLKNAASGDTVTIGTGTSTAQPTGAVTVNVTAEVGASGGKTDVVTVNGGKTVAVSQKVGSTAAQTSNGSLDFGKIDVKASAITESVTIQQDTAKIETTTAATPAVAEVTSVKFVDLAAGDTFKVGDFDLPPPAIPISWREVQGFAG